MKVISFQDSLLTAGSRRNVLVCFAVAQVSGHQGLAANRTAQAFLWTSAINLEGTVCFA